MRDTFWKVIVTVALIAVLTFGAGLFIVQGVKNTAGETPLRPHPESG